MQRHSRILAAETVGTAILMMGGPGSAILAGSAIGTLGVALAFGLTLLLLAYTTGHVSGCHVNPAVTLGMLITRKITPASAPFYLIGQFLGAAIGATIIFGIASGLDDFDSFGNFAQNGWGEWSPAGYGLGSAIIVEIVFTAVLMFVILSTTHRGFPLGFSGMAIGLTLGVIHLVTIPVDNTSVNPARCFGSALFSDPEAWTQLWVFIVFPVVGALIGVFVWLMIDDSKLEDTMVHSEILTDARDFATKATDQIVVGLEELTDGD